MMAPRWCFLGCQKLGKVWAPCQIFIFWWAICSRQKLNSQPKIINTSDIVPSSPSLDRERESPRRIGSLAARGWHRSWIARGIALQPQSTLSPISTGIISIEGKNEECYLKSTIKNPKNLGYISVLPQEYKKPMKLWKTKNHLLLNYLNILPMTKLAVDKLNKRH